MDPSLLSYDGPFAYDEPYSYDGPSVGPTPPTPGAEPLTTQIQYRRFANPIRRDPYADGEAAHFKRQLVKRPWSR